MSKSPNKPEGSPSSSATQRAVISALMAALGGSAMLPSRIAQAQAAPGSVAAAPKSVDALDMQTAMDALNVLITKAQAKADKDVAKAQKEYAKEYAAALAAYRNAKLGKAQDAAGKKLEDKTAALQAALKKRESLNNAKIALADAGTAMASATGKAEATGIAERKLADAIIKLEGAQKLLTDNETVARKAIAESAAAKTAETQADQAWKAAPAGNDKDNKKLALDAAQEAAQQAKKALTAAVTEAVNAQKELEKIETEKTAAEAARDAAKQASGPDAIREDQAQLIQKAQQAIANVLQYTTGAKDPLVIQAHALAAELRKLKESMERSAATDERDSASAERDQQGSVVPDPSTGAPDNAQGERNAMARETERQAEERRLQDNERGNAQDARRVAEEAKEARQAFRNRFSFGAGGELGAGSGARTGGLSGVGAVDLTHRLTAVLKAGATALNTGKQAGATGHAGGAELSPLVMGEVRYHSDDRRQFNAGAFLEAGFANGGSAFGGGLIGSYQTEDGTWVDVNAGWRRLSGAKRNADSASGRPLPREVDADTFNVGVTIRRNFDDFFNPNR